MQLSEYRKLPEATLQETYETDFISQQKILENVKMYDPISPKDKKKLQLNLFKIKLNFIDLETPNNFDLIGSLTYINDLLNRIKLTKIEFLNELSFIQIFIFLSMSENEKIRTLSLSILATLTDYIYGIENELFKYSFIDSIVHNLSSPFFRGQSHVFRWIQNFFIHYKQFSEIFFEKVPFQLIFDSSNSYLSEISQFDDATKIEKKICQSMFCVISSCNLNSDEIILCINFFNEFFDTKMGGMQFALTGIHKIISNKSYAQEFLSQVVEQLNFKDFLTFYCKNDTNNRKKSLCFCILGDLFELGFHENDLVLSLLECTFNDENTVWFNHSLIKSLRKIVSCCSDELLPELFDFCMYLIEINNSPNFKIRKEIFYCIGIYMNRLSNEQLINFLNEEAINALFSNLPIHNDEELLRLMIESIFRLIAAAENFGQGDTLYALVKNCESVDCLETICVSDYSSEELSQRILELCEYFNEGANVA